MNSLYIVIIIIFVRVKFTSEVDGCHPPAKSNESKNKNIRYITKADCRKQIRHFMDELTNNEAWAVKMFEASSKHPLGMLAGNNYQFGEYDKCIAAESPNHLIHGKYCIVDIISQYNRPNLEAFQNENEFTILDNPYKSFAERLKVTKDPSKKLRNVLHIGTCVPKICSKTDIENLVRSHIVEFANDHGINVSVKIAPNSCSTADSKHISTAGRKVWLLIGILSNAVILSTVWDAWRDTSRIRKSKFFRVVESFSIKKNVKNLFETNSNGEFDSYHGMKVLSMMLVILGHRCMSSLGGPVFNGNFLEKGYRSFPIIFLLNGILIVDTFFLIGGFLTFITLHHEFQKSQGISTFQVCLHRWLRITPEYMLMVFFYGHVFESLGSGPLWSGKVGREAERCRQNWWTNFLYLNNYIRSDQLCMFQSWYVACDMHYTLISPAIVKLVSKTGKRGLFLLLSLIAASSVAVSVLTYLNKYDAVLRIYPGTFEDLASNKFFSHMYIKSHSRIIPYLSGMATAYTHLKLKESGRKLSQVKLWSFSLLAIVLGLSSICGAWIFYVPGREYNVIENVLYAPLHRLFWSLAIGWIGVETARKSFGIIQPILTSKAFLPFSKLSFGTFLVHGAVQLYTTASLRTPDYISYPKLFWMTCGDIVLSYLFAFILHLLVEAPLKGIQHVLFSKQGSELGIPGNKMRTLLLLGDLRTEVHLEKQ